MSDVITPMAPSMGGNGGIPEAQAILGNILSLLEQLNMVTGGGMAQQAMTNPPDGSTMDMLPEGEGDTEVKKSVPDATGGTAEERIDDQTLTTEESMQDLKKSISELSAALTGGVRKSQTAQTVQKDNLDQSVAQLTAMVQTVLKNQNEINKQFSDQEKFNQGLLESIGLSDQVIRKSLNLEPPSITPKQKPVQNIDAAVITKAVVDGFMQAQKSMTGNQNNNSPVPDMPLQAARSDISELRKSLAQLVRQR